MEQPPSVLRWRGASPGSTMPLRGQVRGSAGTEGPCATPASSPTLPCGDSPCAALLPQPSPPLLTASPSPGPRKIRGFLWLLEAAAPSQRLRAPAGSPGPFPNEVFLPIRGPAGRGPWLSQRAPQGLRGARTCPPEPASWDSSPACPSGVLVGCCPLTGRLMGTAPPLSLPSVYVETQLCLCAGNICVCVYFP